MVALLIKHFSSQNQSADPAEARKMIIDQLAMQLLLSQEATKKGLEKSPEVTDQIDLSKQSILANAYVQDYFNSNPVTDEMLAAEYEKIKSQMGGNEYKAHHILVEKEADAKDIIAKLKKNPKAFEALAKAKSKDPGSKERGGDLGWFDPRGMVPEFGAALGKLEKGKLTDEPVKTQFGYHVIMLDDTRPKVVPPLEQVKPALKQQVQQQNVKKMLEDMKTKAKIEIAAAPAAPATAASPAAAPSSETAAAAAHAAAPAAEAKPAEPAKK